jgi:hypothetical protein
MSLDRITEIPQKMGSLLIPVTSIDCRKNYNIDLKERYRRKFPGVMQTYAK